MTELDRNLGRYSFLLAEDNPANQLLLESYMEFLKISRFKVVSNGVEAVKAYSKSPFDFIIMDIHMPELDGTSALRALEGTIDPNTVVIALTANAMRGDKERFLAAGFHSYLAKPMRLGDLRQVLSGYLSKPRVTHSKSVSPAPRDLPGALTA